MKLDNVGVVLSLISACVAILINGDEVIKPESSQYVFPSMLAIGGLITYLDSLRTNPFGQYKTPSKGWDAESDLTMKRIGIPLWVGALIFLLWAGLLVLVILLVDVFNIENEYLKIFEVMYNFLSICPICYLHNLQLRTTNQRLDFHHHRLSKMPLQFQAIHMK